MSQPLLWLLGLLGVAALSLGCLLMNAPGMEVDIRGEAAGIFGGPDISGSELGNIDLDVSGRDLILTGTVANNAARLAALASARDVPGVARVIDRLTIADGTIAGGADDTASGADTDADARGAFSLGVDPASGALVVRGTVPNEDARAAVLARMAEAFPGREIRDEMTIASGASMGWEPSVMAALPLLGEVNMPGISVEGDPVEGAEVTVEGGEIVIRGSVPTDEDKTRIEDAVRAVIVAPYTLRSELTVDASAGQIMSSGSDDENVRGAEEALREALSIGAVEFESGTSTLTAQSQAILDEAAEAFTRFPTVGAEVQGHTDSQGGDATNQALSQTRAEAVRDYLIGKGVDAGQLEPRGYGEARPIADNDTAEGRARNRRVVFSLRSL